MEASMKKLLWILALLVSVSFADLEKRFYSEALQAVNPYTTTTITVSGYPSYYSFKPINGNVYLSLDGATATASIVALDLITQGSLYSPDMVFKVGDTITMFSTSGTPNVYILRYVD
jgi:hypothetical protein